MRISLRELIGIVTIAGLLIGLTTSTWKLRRLKDEVGRLREEVGDLGQTEADEIAAVRLSSDQPLTYRFRVRVPETAGAAYRIAYSTWWPQSKTRPEWFAATPVPPGDSVVVMSIGRDVRDDRWKISTLVRNPQQTRRVATVLPEPHVDVFRGSHDVVRTGIGREVLTKPVGRSIRILEDRWLVGEGSLMLYGDSGPDEDQIGVYAELQLDDGPL
ncbi:LapA family protein [Crateriforma conspicua]|uniref:Uncharacterized protein n=1 Tax=Crateriforma conspicua TaxID=2527996 RepID=A0A5C6FY12_9PLAN|nr:LapA family protein [Crateriforma conspicua]TWU66210.1 hypothetical protein V7x_17690 [Crateriforma conspicua]